MFDPSFLPYVVTLAPHRLLFHVRDAYCEMPRWSGAAEAQYRAMQQRADIISVASNSLSPLLFPDVVPKVRPLLKRAGVAAVEAASGARVPPALEDIPRPRVGYSGVLSLEVGSPP